MSEKQLFEKIESVEEKIANRVENFIGERTQSLEQEMDEAEKEKVQALTTMRILEKGF